MSRRQQQLLWQTRELAIFIAATVPVEKEGDANPLLDAAKRIGEGIISDNESKDKGKDDDYDENGVKYNSYEHFMTVFGGAMRGRPAG